tara:strand:- start:2252 stop:3664 length:1413 start_codon:yes stop_codon:yes gene_type:complete
MQFILGTNSVKDTGYEVDNSVRVNRGDSDSMSGATNGTSTNQNKYTVSFWTKRGRLSNSSTLNIMEGYTGSSDTGTGNIFWRTTEALVIGGYNTNWRITDRLFRDISAWYHIVIAMDTTQSTADNRVKVYVNGVEETSFSTKNNPSQNSNTGLNNNSAALNLFRRVLFGVNDNHGDGYFSEFCFIDGQALDPTSFGEFDEDSGIWKPINVSGLTFGNNGFYLEFKDSSALGDDSSSNGNDFTLNNLTSIDQTTDTCTNNFSTFNSLVPLSTGDFEDGNCKNKSSSSTNFGAASTIGVSTGKWYAEFRLNSVTGQSKRVIGVIGTLSGNGSLSGAHYAYVWYTAPNDNQFYSNGSSSNVSWSKYGTGDIVGIALDMDNNKVWFSKNGTFQNGDPSAGSDGSSLGTSPPDGVFYFCTGDFRSSDVATWEANFGNPIRTISSGNSDADGHGNFEYAVPSGFFALNTKNLAEYG